MNHIVLCADDYGQTLAISKGIIALISEQRLSATSCLVNGADWTMQASLLKPYQNQVDVGLHFNLTEGEALSPIYRKAYGSHFQPLSKLMLKSLLRQLDVKIIAAELHAQLDQFAAGLSAMPTFIDGHQHVQQFPVIRDALMQVYLERFPNKDVYLRWVNSLPTLKNWDAKKLVIYLLGTRAFKQLLVIHDIPHNFLFSGIYSFKNAQDYPSFFREFLNSLGGDGIVMCHPALSSDEESQQMASARYYEYLYLSSAQFQEDCRSARTEIVRFSALSLRK